MDTNLREQILSEENIYKAIFAVESYISERNLLSASDLDVFLRLRISMTSMASFQQLLRIARKL